MKTAAATREILDLLEGQHPGADTELHFKNAFQLLAATILFIIGFPSNTDALANTIRYELVEREQAGTYISF